MNLWILSNRPMAKKLNWVLVFFILISFIGFLDSFYLTIQHFRQGIVPCYVFEGCDEVLSSKYASIYGVPVSLIGVVYYLTNFLLAVFYFDTKNKKVIQLLRILPLLGFLATILFVYLQAFVIKSFCFYCVVSAILSTALFILSIYIVKLSREEVSHE